MKAGPLRGERGLRANIGARGALRSKPVSRARGRRNVAAGDRARGPAVCRHCAARAAPPEPFVAPRAASRKLAQNRVANSLRNARFYEMT